MKIKFYLSFQTLKLCNNNQDKSSNIFLQLFNQRKIKLNNLINKKKIIEEMTVKNYYY